MQIESHYQWTNRKGRAVEKGMKVIVQPPEREVKLSFEDEEDLNRHRKHSTHPHSGEYEHSIQQLFMNYLKNDKHHITYNIVAIFIWPSLYLRVMFLVTSDKKIQFKLTQIIKNTTKRCYIISFFPLSFKKCFY